ncbi:hypothetical protein PZ897_12530 [Hoeflea sp. YIM 152468]|uniref:hypothetical protein n=1 Tax=Hoeflea sp. YIM 152468 TaxID=3031759 RepID=UPI0023DAFB4B|nr:hypothetical protein [Hoeflea sp. YIM 152468]MDF1609003.1 hypothetical protein [Hoeflea sp. YIM 152468]
MNIEGVGLSSIQTARQTGLTREPASTLLSYAIESYQDLGPISDVDDHGTYDSIGQVTQPVLRFASSQPNGYEIFLPVRAGHSSTNLAIAVTDPSAEPFSSGNAKSEVSELARRAIDARYQQMADSGQPFRPKSNEAVDWYTAFGDLDRRALNAIRTDESGLFSAVEMEIAQSIMTQQQSLAMGLYQGPSRLAGAFADKDGRDPSDHMAVGRAGALWLDQVSLEEKRTSPEWMEQRAAAQYLYESTAAQTGKQPEKLSSGFGFVDRMVQAYSELEKLGEGHELNYLPSYQHAWQMFVDQVPQEQSTSMTLFF